MADETTTPTHGLWHEIAPTLTWMAFWGVLGVMVFLLAYPPHLAFDADGDVARPKATCSSVVEAGWPHTLTTSDVASGVKDSGTAYHEPLEDLCHTRRSLAVAETAVLTVPASLLGCWLIVARRDRRARRAAG